MNFGDLRTEVSEQTKLSLDDSTVSSRISRHLNQSYRKLVSKRRWPFLYRQEIIQTSADITTGTATINSGSTALTLSSGPSVSVVGWFIQFSSSKDWYEIMVHTSGATTATITPSYGPTANLSAGTYTLRKVLYSLGSTTGRILSIRQARTPAKLAAKDVRTFDVYRPDPTATGNPTAYYDFGFDSSNNRRVGFHPNPNAAINFGVRYVLRITEMSTDTDTPVIPADFHYVIVDGALQKTFRYLGDEIKSKSSKMDFDEGVQTMEDELMSNEDVHHVMRKFDDDLAGASVVPFPSAFGPMTYK